MRNTENPDKLSLNFMKLTSISTVQNNEAKRAFQNAAFSFNFQFLCLIKSFIIHH